MFSGRCDGMLLVEQADGAGREKRGLVLLKEERGGEGVL